MGIKPTRAGERSRMAGGSSHARDGDSPYTCCASPPPPVGVLDGSVEWSLSANDGLAGGNILALPDSPPRRDAAGEAATEVEARAVPSSTASRNDIMEVCKSRASPSRRSEARGE